MMELVHEGVVRRVSVVQSSSTQVYGFPCISESSMVERNNVGGKWIELGRVTGGNKQVYTFYSGVESIDRKNMLDDELQFCMSRQHKKTHSGQCCSAHSYASFCDASCENYAVCDDNLHSMMYPVVFHGLERKFLDEQLEVN